MSFESEWANARRVVLQATERTIRGTALKVFSAIIKASPVDTGRFKGNWQCSVERPLSGELEIEDKDGGVTIAAAEAAIATYTTMKSSIFLTNNLPYADRLANGWSKQRPSGWIETIVSGFQQAANKSAKENEAK